MIRPEIERAFFRTAALWLYWRLGQMESDIPLTVAGEVDCTVELAMIIEEEGR